MYRLGFIIEQTLGHVTHGQNLQAAVRQDPAIQAAWALPAFEATGMAGRLPVYRTNWTLRAGLRTRRALADLARPGQPDALFFHTQVTAVLSQDWLRRIPSVVSLDATPRQYDRLGEHYDHAAGPGWLEGLKWRLNRDCFRLARRLVTWSEWARDGLVDEYEVPIEKITVIPPGVDACAWAPPCPRSLAAGPVKILFVGGNLKRKGGLLLLEVFRSFRNRAELHLVTRDPVPAEPGVFVYPDLQPNTTALKQLYHACDIFCLPTFGDCLPMVLSEAGAAGLPAISTRVAAIPEIIAEGETGILVPPGDRQALSAALQRMIDEPDLRLRQGAEAVRRVQAQFDASSNAVRLVNLLKEVADEERNRRV